MKLPKVSICTCTYNGDRILEKYFEKIFSQDYPKDRIEIILADGGSSDNTLKIIEKYKKQYPKIISSFHNKEQYSIGKGKGMDQATRKAKGDIIVQIDQDNILVQKDWISKMVKILMENPDITGVQSRLMIPKNSSPTDKYVNALGIEDPFAVNYSLNAQITFHPEKFHYNEKGKFFVYTINKDNFFYAGDNGFVIRKKDFLETGGYIQDIENFYRMALSNKKYKIAVPVDIKLHHQTTTGLKHMIEKRIYYVGNYILKNYDERVFYWWDKRNSLKQNRKFIFSVMSNLLFLPSLVSALKMTLKRKQAFWLIHPFAVFSITVGYIYKYFYSLWFGEQKEAKI